MAKILIYDIETSPNLAYVWGKWQQDVIAFQSEWELLSWSAKWLGEKKTIDVGRNQFSEEVLVRRLHQLFDEADIVIAHNGDQFDQKMMNAKYIQFGLQPPSPYRSIDTKKVAKRYFRFNSNKLDDLGALLGLGRKVQTGGFSLWLGCMNNDTKAWKTMLRYNRQDVLLLEKVYLKLRPWIENHPALNVIDDIQNGCPKCGSTKMHRRGTRKVNKTTTVQRYQCQKCGGWSQGRSTERAHVQYVN